MSEGTERERVREAVRKAHEGALKLHAGQADDLRRGFGVSGDLVHYCTLRYDDATCDAIAAAVLAAAVEGIEWDELNALHDKWNRLRAASWTNPDDYYVAKRAALLAALTLAAREGTPHA